MFAWWCLVACVVGSAGPAEAVVGGDPAAPPEPDAAVIFVQKHGYGARVEGLRDNRLGYYSFFGIRYAEPPLGPRRFQRPVRQLLAGDVTANRTCAPCPQPHPYNPNLIIGQEDCLCLNVFAPKMPGEERGSPVVFFIHGGNYRTGSTSPYGGQHLTQKDTILVTAQYRLGSLGYFSTAERDASGNAGLFDLRAVMAWIEDYIEFFGGDKSRIVVMGQGSGGSAASLIALSSEGRSATGVAALSGTPLSPGAIRPDPERYAKELANRTGCPQKPVERLVNCLRKMSAEKIVQADKSMDMDNVDTAKFLNDISQRSGAGARVEGEDDLRGLPPMVSEQPTESLKKKRQTSPLLTGVTSAETARAVFGKYSQFLTQQLQTVKDFIKKDLIGGLQNTVQSVQGLVPLPTSSLTQALPLADYYQALFDSSLNAVDGLTQIAEATGDALFNFPAYQSVKQWSTGEPAYLYSFEHVGNLSKGSHFLPGVPLADDTHVNKSEGDGRSAKGPKGPSHGDELAYIFEPLDENGEPVQETVSSTDARVRNNFLDIVSKFAHNLRPIDESNNQSKSFGLLPFSKNNDQFIKIKDEVTLDKNFRFCQMGLWGNIGERLTGALCKNLLGNLLNLPKLPFQVTNPKLPVDLPGNNLPMNNLPVNILPTNNLPVVGGVGNLLGGGRKPKTTEEPKQVMQITRNPSKPRSGGMTSLLNGL